MKTTHSDPVTCKLCLQVLCEHNMLQIYKRCQCKSNKCNYQYKVIKCAVLYNVALFERGYCDSNVTQSKNRGPSILIKD